MNQVRVVIIMGVSGSGKSTVGEALARAIGWKFHDGDHSHSAANRTKMAAGMPLTDADRQPWLETLRQSWVDPALAGAPPVVLACSALKPEYRQTLGTHLPGVRLVYLEGNYEMLQSRLAHRGPHFMKPGMLSGQLDTLIPPNPNEALTLPISKPVNEIVEMIRQQLDECVDVKQNPGGDPPPGDPAPQSKSQNAGGGRSS